MMSSGGYHQSFLSPIPEQNARRGRSRNARGVPPPLPILPPFPDARVEKVKLQSKKAKNDYRKKDTLAAEDRVEEEESRHDEVFTRMIAMNQPVFDSVMRERLVSLDSSNGSGKHGDAVLRSTIASWKESKTPSLIASTSSLRSDADPPPDISTTPSDELPFFERKSKRKSKTANDPDSSTRDQYQISRLQAKVHQRKQRPQRRIVEENELDLKHLRASRIKVVRGLYQTNTQLSTSISESITNKSSNDDLSSVRDLTTLSSWRNPCYDKMLYLLNDVAPLEDTEVPCVPDEGTTSTAQVSVAELKLIKKTVQSPKQESNDEGVVLPEHIVDTDTIASKLSDVTSPTIQDGFELDEVPHFPRTTAASKTDAVSLSSPEHLPCLAEVNESSEDLHAANSKSLNDFGIKEASRLDSSTCSSFRGAIEEEERPDKAEVVTKKSTSLPLNIETSFEGESPKDEEDADEEASIEASIEASMLEEVTSILCEREAEMEANARAVALLRKTTPSVKKHVTFFFDHQKTQAVPQNHCCIIM